MRLAVVADIHGNLAALEAVVADMSRQAPDRVVNLGDCLSGPLQAGETAERLMQLGWHTIRGNHDRYLIEQTPREMGPSDRSAYEELADHHLDWLTGLPFSLALEGGSILACHATPEQDDLYLTETVTEEGAILSSPEEIADRLGSVDAELILTAHSHIPRLVAIEDRLIVNPGSVGLQAFDDAHPMAHVVETGSPFARYALLEYRRHRWQVDFRTVPYDWSSMSRLAAARGRPDWAEALATGFALRT